MVAGLIVTTVALVLTGHAVNLRLRRWARLKLTRTARLTLRRFRARVDRFKFTGKAHMRRRLLADPVVAKAVALQAAAQEDPDVGVDLDGSWERAEDYLEEISELREQFAGRGIRSWPLNHYYASPQNEADLRTISTALLEMAGRLRT